MNDIKYICDHCGLRFDHEIDLLIHKRLCKSRKNRNIDKKQSKLYNFDKKQTRLSDFEE